LAERVDHIIIDGKTIDARCNGHVRSSRRQDHRVARLPRLSRRTRWGAPNGGSGGG